MDFERSKVGCEVKTWSQLGPNLVIGTSWAKSGRTSGIDWTKLGFWSIIGQNMGDPDCVGAPLDRQQIARLPKIMVFV